jgi:hypothetical protein
VFAGNNVGFHRLKSKKKIINQPPRPGNEPCKNQKINCPGHPSFKRRGNFGESPYLQFYSQLAGYSLTPAEAGQALSVRDSPERFAFLSFICTFIFLLLSFIF